MNPELVSGGAVLPISTGSTAVVSMKGASIRTDEATPTYLIRDVHLSIGPGLTAIMGATGAGKTSLLNAVAGHQGPGLILEGERRINGFHYTPQQVHFGYALQAEEFNGNLTVIETLRYAADLMLSHDLPKAREERIVALLKELGLYHVRDVVIGTATRKGISGGQRKRVGIALALLTEPPLLLLDEPTAGLDSVTAMTLLDTLKNMSVERRTTIICVIHQPQRAIFELLDRLILIRTAEILYDGRASDCVPYLERLGYPYDGVSNPADFIMEMVSPRLGETKAELDRRCRIRPAYVRPEVDLSLNEAEGLPMPHLNASRPEEFATLFRRQFVTEVREWPQHILSLFVTVGCALLIGGVWFDLGDAQTSVDRRSPALFFCAINQSLFAALKTALAFPSRSALVIRERRMKMYRCSPAFTSWSLVDIIFAVPWSILFAIVTYFMIGLQNHAGKFFIFASLLILDKVSASSLAMMVCGILQRANTAMVVLPVALEITRLFGGFFLPPALLPSYYVWLDPLSYVKYVYVGFALNEYQGLVLPCPPHNATNTTVASTCNPNLAQAKIKSLELDFIPIGGCVGALLAYITFTRLVAYIAVRRMKHIV